MTNLKHNPPEDKDKQDVSESLQTFETRWRYAVFPAMVTFVLLIGFMFYLIYGMLQRMEDLSRDIHGMSLVIIEAMPVMQGGILGMSSRMQFVGEDMKKMSVNMNDMSEAIVVSMPKLEKNVEKMTANVGDMTVATTSMALTTHNMGQNLWDMNRNFSKPLSAMNKILPWSNKNRPPRPPMPPPILNPAPSAPMYGGVAAVPQGGYGVPVTTMQGIPSYIPSGIAVNTASSTVVAGGNKYQGFCASCHGARGEGGVGPLIQGKSGKYITQVLDEYRNGTRKGTMTGVVEVLSDEDIKNVAAFIASGKLQ